MRVRLDDAYCCVCGCSRRSSLSTPLLHPHRSTPSRALPSRGSSLVVNVTLKALPVLYFISFRSKSIPLNYYDFIHKPYSYSLSYSYVVSSLCQVESSRVEFEYCEGGYSNASRHQIKIILCAVLCSIEKVPSIAAPALVIHGRQDEVIHVSHGYALFERLPNKVDPLWVDGAGHNGAFVFFFVVDVSVSLAVF